MGTVPIPPPRPRTQYGGQSNKALLRLMRVLDDAVADIPLPAPEVAPQAGRMRRHVQILARHPDGAEAQRQAEQKLSALRERYGCEICCSRGTLLTERFAAEGLVGYLINCEIEVAETLFALPGGMCLSYEAIPGDQKA